MDEKTIQFRVGVLVVATVILTMFLVMLFGELPGGFQKGKYIYIRFTSAPGVMPNTPVRKSGILIGRVDDVQLEDDGKVLVIAKLDTDRIIRENEICRINRGALLGDSMLEFVPSTAPGLSREPLKDGALLNGTMAPDALSSVTNAVSLFDDLAGDLKSTLAAVKEVGNDIGGVAQSLNSLVINNQDQFNRVLSKAEQAMGRFDTAMISVNQLTDQQVAEQFRTALESLPKLVEDASGLIRGLQGVADEAEANLKNLQGLTKPLGDAGKELVTTLDQSLNRLDSVLMEMQVFSKSLNSGEGSLGQFVHNPELYQRLNQTASNLEALTYQLEPILSDARVISDKLARNPGRILRGAIGRQQSGLK